MSVTCVYKSSKYRGFPSTCLSLDKEEKFKSLPIQDLIVEGDSNKIIKRYFWAIGAQRDQINKVFRNIYRENLNIKDKNLSEIILAIKTIEERNKLSMDKIAQELRDYIGYDTQFYRQWDDGELHPIRIEVIEKAYMLMKLHAPIMEIEKCLFLKFKVDDKRTTESLRKAQAEAIN